MIGQLRLWLQTNSKETELLIIADNPVNLPFFLTLKKGLGKTTAPYAFAIHEGIGYVVLEAGMQ